MKQQELEALLGRSGWIRRLAEALVPHQDLVDDVVQETWLAAVRNPPRAAGLGRWIAATVGRVSARLCRGERRRLEVTRQLADLEPGQSAAETAERLALIRTLLDAVEALPEPLRTAVRLRYFDGLTIREVAHALNVPASTLQSRLDRALGRLRSRLDATCGGDRRRWCVGLLGLASPTATALAPAGLASAASSIGGVLSMNITLVKSGAALLAAAAALAVVWQFGRPAPAPTPGTTDLGRTQAAATLPGPELTGVHPAAPQRLGNEGAPASASPGTDTAAPKLELGVPPTVDRPAARWRLVGSVLNLDPALLPRAGIKVSAIESGLQRTHGAGMEPVVIEADISRPFEIDVSTLFQGADPPQELNVVVDHVAYMPCCLRLKTDEGQTDPVANQTVFRFQAELIRAGGLCGAVRNARGEPAVGAHVGVFRMDAEGAPQPQPVDAVRCDAEGRYRLRAATPSRYLVAAVGEAECRPACAVGSVAAGREVLMPDLVLPPGAAITGTVRVLGEPESAASLVAEVARGGAPLRLSPLLAEQLVYGNGVVERRLAEARTDEQGRFRLSGLAAEVHRLWVGELREDSRPHTRQRATLREVIAPAAGIVLDVPAARITVEVYSRESAQPIRGARVSVKSDTTIWVRGTDAAGRAVFAPTPGSYYGLVIEAGGYEGREMQIAGAPEGASQLERVALEVHPPGTALLVTVDGPAAENLDQIVLRFERLDRAPSSLRRTVRRRDEGFWIGDLAPGHYRVTLMPELGAALGYALPECRDIQVLLGETARLDFRPALGGRIRLEVRDRDGKFAVAQCRVTDQAGRLVEVRFSQRFPSGGIGHSKSWILEAGPADTDPPLPPGSYSVEVSDRSGRVHTVIPVSVHGGRTVVVSTILDAR
ncbi:MAG: sigma-70 family RNA polymerase sigma factor [Planctomycetes bacterium]|nr:sigma-70 family RNA polymerase sigma factor [Planctomycetota bacterium]